LTFPFNPWLFLNISSELNATLQTPFLTELSAGGDVTIFDENWRVKGRIQGGTNYDRDWNRQGAWEKISNLKYFLPYFLFICILVNNRKYPD
jgi:hypothetical protein